jgi:hypothetical protein
MYVALEGRGTFVSPNDEVPVSVRMISIPGQKMLNVVKSGLVETYLYPGTIRPSWTKASRV